MNISLSRSIQMTLQLCLLVLLQACVAQSSKKVSVAAISDLVINTQPVSQAVVLASDVTFTVNASSSENISYQWYMSNVPIPGATGSSFTIASVGFEDTGLYYVVVRDSVASVKSLKATLTVSPTSIAPVIRTQPASVLVTEGFTANFSVVATGTNLSYQWFKGLTPLDGETKSTLSIIDVLPANAGSYHVVVSNDASNVRSFSARLTVNAIVIAPVITTDPASVTVTEGNLLALTVVATGSNLTYQWYQDGLPISGAILATYSVGAVALGDAGFYQVVVSNTGGSVLSSGTVVSVTPLLTAPVISQQPLSVTAALGTEVTFSVTASGVGNEYEWLKDGDVIDEATTDTLTISSVLGADAGVYQVEISNNLGTVLSNEVTLTISLSTNGVNTVNVVNSVLNFMNSLNVDQKATLQIPFTLANAKIWSAGTVAAAPRNGLSLSQVDNAQMIKALQVTETALSAEGSILVTEILAADTELKGYDSINYADDKYNVAVLGTPSLSDAWMFQMSGHNLGVNIAYNAPFFTGTPLFLATEPANWTDNGFTSHAPMEKQRLAMKNLFAKVSGKTGVVIGGTFTDVLMSANGTAGYDTNYPQTYPSSNRGVLVSTFTTAEKEAVKLAIEAWVNLLAADVAAEILTAYEDDSALDATYVAINKSNADFNANPSGTSGKNSYIRIDGPRVWIEFLVTAGTVVTTKVQYRSVWRDKSADYGAEF